MCTQIKSKEDLYNLYNNVKDLLDVRKGIQKDKGFDISICGGSGCFASHSKQLYEELIQEVKKHNLEDKVNVTLAGCFGFCEKGPIVKISPDHTFYVKVKPIDAKRIIEQHIMEGKVIDDLIYVNPFNHQKVSIQEEIPFYKKQHRVALRNCGFINPLKINEYIAMRGYQALAKCLFDSTPLSVIDEIKKSGLRGRGGGGFPTGIKWKSTHDSVSDKKYVICNADEGDPGAFMDRSILEGDSFSVVEAMTIAGYAIGSDEGQVYIRAEYPLAVERLRNAINQARELGLLGKNIMGTNFSFDIKIKYGAGAFVCGEETALINSIQGNRGEPKVKPPFPAQEGLWGKPTLVNNVETLANIPVIILDGAEKFASIGSEKSKGTKVFALAGKINNVGLVEVPMGTTLREIIFDIGGGIKNDRKFKAVQTGGPSGGCISEKNLDTPIDFDNLIAIGSMMGSGGMIVMDEDDCMVNIAKFYLDFTVDESCGKCTPCRIGTKRLLEILEKITKGKGTKEDLEKLEALSNVIKDTALCGLGQSAPNPVLSTLKHFRNEYEAHVINQYCPSRVCKGLNKYQIDIKNCLGCGKCAKVCPVEAIAKTDHPAKNPRLQAYQINGLKCIDCGACSNACPVKVISK